MSSLALARIIQLFVFEYDHCVFSQLLELKEQEPYLMLVLVMWEVKSKTILKNFKIWDFLCMIRVTHNPWLESNQTVENMMILVCDSNHNLHVIRVMQYYDSNHKLHMIRITHLLLATTSFDLNHTSYMNRITSFVTFLCLVLIKLIRIKLCTWLESRVFMTRITGNGSLLFMLILFHSTCSFDSNQQMLLTRI